MKINLPEKRYYSIGEVAKAFEVNTSLLRYWEKEFKQIKPTIINGRRYYSFKDIKTIQNIKFYLKDQKMTIAGVKLILNTNRKKLDDLNRVVYTERHKFLLENKSKKLLSKIKNLKKYGKKISS